jgi:hypothetical protein
VPTKTNVGRGIAALGASGILLMTNPAASSSPSGRLELTFSKTGAITSLKIADKELARSLPSGFFWREVSSPIGVGINPSFEPGTSGWTWRNNANGSWSLDAKTAIDGTKSLRIDMPATTERRSPTVLSDWFPIAPGSAYTLSAAAKTTATGGGLSVYVLEKSASGAAVQRGVSWPPGTADWKYRTLSFTSGPAAAQAQFKVEIYSGYGTAWVDDLQLQTMAGAAARVPGTYAGSKFTGSAGGIDLEANHSQDGAAVRVDVKLRTAGQPRAVEVSFRLPVGEAGWKWHSDLATATTIATGQRHEMDGGGFPLPGVSLYPLATISDAMAALTLAIPVEPAVVQRFSYETGTGLVGTWDLGLTPVRNVARFSFWIYATDPEWGMRGAAERYYELQPEAFKTTFANDGAWIVGSGWETVSRP